MEPSTDKTETGDEQSESEPEDRLDLPPRNLGWYEGKGQSTRPEQEEY